MFDSDETTVETDTEPDAGTENTEAGVQAEATDEPDTFPRSYVEQLRAENQRYRERGKNADELARRLHTELVRATGRLADPSDLAFDETHLADPDALTAALDDLLTRKPHMATRRPAGDIGQGAVSEGGSTVDLAAILRQRAG